MPRLAAPDRAITVHRLWLITVLTFCGCDRHQQQRSPVRRIASDQPAPRPWFEDIARQAGVDFLHDSGHRRRFLFPESVCGGAALVDVDSDGWLDLYLIQGGPLDGAGGGTSRPGNR